MRSIHSKASLLTSDRMLQKSFAQKAWRVSCTARWTSATEARPTNSTFPVVSSYPQLLQPSINSINSAMDICDVHRPVEIVNVRVRIVAAAEPYSPPYRAPVPGDGAPALYAARNIVFAGRFVKSSLYRRERLSPGDLIHGPAMITEYTSATVLPPACSAQVDGYGNLVIAVAQVPA